MPFAFSIICIIKMRIVILILVCVGEFRLQSDKISVSAVQIFNPKEIIDSEITIDPNSSGDVVRSEALIKRIHPFIFPKQFNTLDAMATNAFNISNDRGGSTSNSNAEILNKNDRTEESHFELMPSSIYLSNELKHNSLYNSVDRPAFNYHHHTQNLAPIAQGNNCLLGLLRPGDPLFVMGILAFLAYVISSVLNLVDRLNLPLLVPATSVNMSAVPTATNALIASNKALVTPRQHTDNRFLDNSQNLLRDFERILQMAIELYDHKMNIV